ncbi:hypothetical protein ACTPOE_16565 [Castellaniella sp. WN]
MIAAAIWAVAKAYWRPLAVAAILLVIAAAGIVWYGHTQYRAGYTAAETKAKLAAIAIEQGMQYERDRADAEHRGAVLAREAAARDLVAMRGRLDEWVRRYGRDPANPRAGRRPDAAGPDWIGGFAACYGEYADLAADAARWADQVNGLQGYVRAVRAKKSRP